MTKIIVVAGPTASGKTSVGIKIAKAVGGEIISADSMQVYKDMPVATACPTKEEQSQVPHHLVEIIDRNEKFSVAVWCRLAEEKIKEITARGNIPVIVGGTGLFIDSLVDHIKFEDVGVDENLRNSLLEKDTDTLYSELLKLDPQSAKGIHKNNKKRVVRALELYYSGVSKTEQNMNSRKESSPYEVLYFVLGYNDRQKLYNRINKRVDMMLSLGLKEEAARCLESSSGTSAQAIGHKELIPYFNGACSLEDALENLKKETRHYAKRQITWFKRRDDAVFLMLDENRNQAVETAVNMCEDFINGKFTGRKSE